MAAYAEAHKWSNLAGAGDARPTALQIIKDYHKEGSLKGKTILITGVSSGIGASTAIALAATGATIYCAGRSIEKAKESLKPIADYPGLHFLSLDLLSLEHVRSFAKEFLAHSGGKLNILINNAGGTSVDAKKSADGIEYQFALNYLGHFYLYTFLQDALLSSATPEAPSRVINVTSTGHRYNTVQFDNINLEGEFQSHTAYGQAKTAENYMAIEIDRRFGARNLHAWCLHPGAIEESNFIKAGGYDEATVEALLEVWPKKQFKSNDQGAATTVWAAVTDDVLAEGAKGKYLEDCSVARPSEETDKPEFRGYVAHTYDEAAARRLWDFGLEFIASKVKA
ncbi:Short-chain dehydrogenase/reductase prx1 [Cladobotryum mycophilum]|uniref:Short-chain dehydrogenase/reductase prx1 n=1 Tax=Cladobotryum mycophilum TaxID=491253 RepID=A0ABR0SBC6_9HYPO